ncbi:MAG: ABC transporter ATP-binding protein [Clostridia bacterium]|nr:ABC transporter ATP-binding protein [Clostridia bacterium]
MNRFRFGHLVRRFTRGCLAKYAGCIFAVAATVALGFATPLMLSGTIDMLVAAASGDTAAPLNYPGPVNGWFTSLGGIPWLINHLWAPALMLLALYLLSSAFQYFRGRWSTEASEAIAKNIRDDLYGHMQSLDYEYHAKAQTGDLIQRCTSDVETIRRFLSGQVVEIFRSVCMIALALTILVHINAKMTLMSCILLPPLFLFAWLFFTFVHKSFRTADIAEGRMSAVLQENLTGMRVVRAFGREQFEVERFDEVNDDLLKKNARMGHLLSVYWMSGDFISMVQNCITLAFGVYLALAHPGELSAGELTVFITYISMIMWPVRQLGRILSDMGKSLVALERIGEVLSEPSESDGENTSELPVQGDIVFDHVRFEYEAKNPVLTDVSFTAKEGTTVAILGATGSGKSTMMLLLQRLYDPKAGTITIGGNDIRRFSKKHLRRHIGLILQEPFLYSRTVRDNLAIVRPDAPDEDVFRAAATASADGFIRDFENGYATMVGERGVTLSGGQKQRVAIARTLLKQNDVLIFDDSLSAVDTETDRAIRQALREQRSEGGRCATTFIISHRLTTLSEADLILVLDGGRIVQQGTHEQLIHRDGLYRRIYRIQSDLKDELDAAI